MFTLYEVKQNECFKWFYKCPNYCRNFFLMIILMMIMIPVYFSFFHIGDGSYESMFKILKGYNSATFNYLENNKEVLLVNKPIPVYHITD